MTVCMACQAGNPPEARFCNQCGQRLDAGAAPRAVDGDYTPRHLREGALRAASAISGERKRVTVLFADIKGSTRLAAEAGAELWHEVLDRFFGLLGAAVHGHDGTINQYTGDGIMALFGAPLALEDHARCAALAALAMQRSVRAYADELRLRHGLNLSMRVGLNSGEVVVGRIGDDLRRDYTAQGATVSLAARLENLCEPGRVYVSQSCAQQLDGYFRLRALGRARLAGFDDQQELFELEGAGTQRERLQRSLARSGSPFLGRDAELQRLQDALQRLQQGQGGVLSVVGEAGLGKSRLCHEFVALCAREGIAVHRCSGVPYGRRVPLLPVRELLRSRLGVPAEANDAAARQWIAGAVMLQQREAVAMLPQLFEFLGIAESGAPPAAEAPGDAQAQQLDRLAAYLCQGPAVLLVEDLHFLDPASEAFVARLAGMAARAPCLLLLNHRPEYAGEALRGAHAQILRLRPLDDAHLLDLARTLLGADAALEPVAAQLVRRAAGHPYFVEEAVLALADGGWLAGAPRAWRLARAIDEWPLPDSVQALLAARIDRLPDAPRQLLQVAAVIGQQFDGELLEAGSGLAAAEIDARLAALETAGLVAREGSGWRFAHPLLQEVAYGGQLESRRRAVHAALAQRLAGHHGTQATPRELALRVAHHWRGAGDHAQAGLWGLVAARWAVMRNFLAAADQCRAAIADLQRAGTAPPLALAAAQARAMLIRLAQFTPVGDEEVERAYAEARLLAPADDVAAHVELLMSYGSLHLSRGEVDVAANLHEQALTRALDGGALQVVNRFRLSYLMSFNAAGRLREVLDWLDAAGGDWRTRAVDAENHMSRAYYGLMLGCMGRLEEGERHLRDAMRVAAREHGAPASWMYTFLVDLALFSGDYAPALAAAESAVQRAEDTGSAFLRAVALRALGLALGLNGRYDEALDALREVLPMVAPGGPAHLYEANLLATLALVEEEAGHVEEAERIADAARDSARRSGSRLWEILATLVWLRLPARPARGAAAAAAMARVEELLALTGAEGFRPWLLLARAQWSGDGEIALRGHAQAREAFTAIGAHAYAAKLCGAPGAGMLH
ncbi:adenylate/guanylate cyclase domain-containing protein [Solimonas soli]|uniref:adenylate/guanylate cyclase domain-containing protein n=1 Tax=Solimonas soli TaxID=413479 RepID=UPI000483EDF9|nr:adenylate/guanylate cyclase domain-containing protein [Solimonas soli]